MELIKAYPEYDLVIHWCMMMAAYPVFVDMCKLIGKISEFQDEINSSTYLFPFEYKIEKETLFEDGRFAMNNFGGELLISLND